MASSTPLVVLAWPVSLQNGEDIPLAPEEPGIVVGWSLTISARSRDMTVVVCAGILSNSATIADVRETIWKTKKNHGRCSCSTCTLDILGTWGEASKDSSLSNFRVSSAGPWWDDQYELPQGQQLLLYRYLSGRDRFRHSSSWNCSGAVLSELVCSYLSEAHSVMDFLSSALYSGDSQQSDCAVDDSLENLAFSRDEVRHIDPACQEKETDGDRKGSLISRVARFVRRHSMILLHVKRFSAEPGGLNFTRQIPCIEFIQCLSTDYWGATYPMDIALWQAKLDRKYVALFDYACAVAVDGALGILAGIFLVFKAKYAVSCFDSFWLIAHDSTFRNGVQWLESFPAGFKLNVPLTQNMGREITTLLHLHELVSTILWNVVSREWLIRLLGAVAICFGFTSLVAFLFDLISLVAAHIVVIATCFRAIHRSQLYLLASLWRLFRGKKKNVLRQRTDTMEYDSMQLLLGMILFTASVFLFTTILVYYAFFAALSFTIRLFAVQLWLIYVVVRFNPLGKCILRVKHPSWFTHQVFLVEVPSLSSDKRIATRIENIPQPLLNLVSDNLSPRLSPLIPSIPMIIVELISGEPCSLYQDCLRCLSLSVDSQK